MNVLEQLNTFTPENEQERRDLACILKFLRNHNDAFSRENLTAHMTASAWVVDPRRSKVLLVYHNIYDSWSWCGGHADGETDLLSVALRECREETGLRQVRPVINDVFSLEILTVDGHEKRGAYVPSHLHMNVTYLLEADDAEPLIVCEGENSGVRWFSLEDALTAPSEPWMIRRVYAKLNRKLERMIGSEKI